MERTRRADDELRAATAFQESGAAEATSIAEVGSAVSSDSVSSAASIAEVSSDAVEWWRHQWLWHR